MAIFFIGLLGVVGFILLAASTLPCATGHTAGAGCTVDWLWNLGSLLLFLSVLFGIALFRLHFKKPSNYPVNIIKINGIECVEVSEVSEVMGVKTEMLIEKIQQGILRGMKFEENWYLLQQELEILNVKSTD